MDVTFNSVGEVIAENTRLRDEALAWHKKAYELEIEVTRLKEQISKLAIENVKLLNRGKSWKEQKADEREMQNNS